MSAESGRRLNVDTIFEGSVQKLGDQLRITAQLVDAANGYQFWSERFDRSNDVRFLRRDHACDRKTAESGTTGQGTGGGACEEA